MFKISRETNCHLFIYCAYIKHVWIEVEGLIGLNDVLLVNSIEDGFVRKWCENENVKKFRALFFIITWCIQLARNTSLFDNIFISPI